MMKKDMMYIWPLLCSLVLIGCGTNNKQDGNVAIAGESSMSILLEGRVELDITRGCQKLFVVHAIDGNGNAIPGLKVNANVIINAKVLGNDTGTIEPTEPVTFVDYRYNFNTEKINPGDTLIVHPTSDRHSVGYLGNWKVHKVEDNRITLLGAAYNLETTDKLYYVVGNNSIYVPDYGTAVAHVEQPYSNDTTVTNDDGYAYFDVVYDLALIGYSYSVGANINDNYRIGAAVTSILPDCINTESKSTTGSESNVTK